MIEIAVKSSIPSSTRSPDMMINKDGGRSAHTANVFVQGHASLSTTSDGRLER